MLESRRWGRWGGGRCERERARVRERARERERERESKDQKLGMFWREQKKTVGGG